MHRSGLAAPGGGRPAGCLGCRSLADVSGERRLWMSLLHGLRSIPTLIAGRTLRGMAAQGVLSE